jgi:hypothetical protein
MSVRIDPHEKEVAERLLADFAAFPSVTVENFYRESWERFSVLEDSTDLQKTIYEGSLKNYPGGFGKLPLAIHRFMYGNLLICAGSYRKVTDPAKGRIYIGLQKGH